MAHGGLVDLVDTRIGAGGVGFGVGSVPPGPQVCVCVLRVALPLSDRVPARGAGALRRDAAEP